MEVTDMATWGGTATIMVGAEVIITIGTNRQPSSPFGGRLGWRPLAWLNPGSAGSHFADVEQNYISAAREPIFTQRYGAMILVQRLDPDKENVDDYSTR